MTAWSNSADDPRRAMVTTENQLNLSLGDNKKDLTDVPLQVDILALGNTLNPGNLCERGELSIVASLKRSAR